MSTPQVFIERDARRIADQTKRYERAPTESPDERRRRFSYEQAHTVQARGSLKPNQVGKSDTIHFDTRLGKYPISGPSMELEYRTDFVEDDTQHKDRFLVQWISGAWQKLPVGNTGTFIYLAIASQDIERGSTNIPGRKVRYFAAAADAGKVWKLGEEELNLNEAGLIPKDVTIPPNTLLIVSKIGGVDFVTGFDCDFNHYFDDTGQQLR